MVSSHLGANRAWPGADLTFAAQCETAFMTTQEPRRGRQRRISHNIHHNVAGLQLAGGGSWTHKKIDPRKHQAALLSAADIHLGNFTPEVNTRRVTAEMSFMCLDEDAEEGEQAIRLVQPDGAPPRFGSKAFMQTAVAVNISTLANFASKNPATIHLYLRRWLFFVTAFCEDDNFGYNPWLVDYVPELFTQFAAWMLGRGKNLNISGFASAFNTVYAMKGLPPVWKGGVITEVIRCYAAAMKVSARGQNRKIASLRVMFAAPALIRLLTLMDRFFDAQEWKRLIQAGILLQMIRNLLRANSASGFVKGDLRRNEQSFHILTIRKVKWGKAHIQPFDKSIPPPPTDNSIAQEAFKQLDRIITLENDDDIDCEFSAEFADFRGNKAAASITDWIQTFLPPSESGVAEGSFNSSHSCRITGANHGLYSAKADSVALQKWGGWKSRVAMEAYIDINTAPCPHYRALFFWLTYGYQVEFESGPAGYDTSMAI